MANDNFSNWLKSMMTFIDRVGFPIFSFIVISCICIYTMKNFSFLVIKNTEAISSLKEVIISMDNSTKYFQGDVRRDHRDFRDMSEDTNRKVCDIYSYLKETKKIKN